MRLFILTTAVALLAGCETATEPTTDTADPVAADSSTAGTSDVGSADYDAITVGPRGIAVISSDGVNTEVGIGTAEARALAALTPLLGAPASQGSYDGCGADAFMRYITWADGLTLNVGSDSTVVGWEAEGDNERIQTASGVQLGAPLDMVRMADSTFEMDPESTLENEFALGETDAMGNAVGGIMSGAGDDSTVRQLFSGMNCFMR